VAAPSLGHYATLSFVVIGKGQKTENLLWERLSRPACPGRGPGELACPEPVEWVEWVEWVEGLTAYFSIIC